MKLHAIISGYVQGVFFRATTKKTAKKLNLKGWVRNLPSGQVEILAIGPKKDLEELLEFLKVGPRWAHVENVKFEFLDENKDDDNLFLNDFEIR
ncbi:MAG: acylphosphatase [Promethearchaeota archaeon]